MTVRSLILWWWVTTFVLVVVLEGVLWQLGERSDVGGIVEHQLETGEAYGPRYFNVGPDYKMELMKASGSEMVVLGSSRAFYFNQSMAGHGIKFCNVSVNASMLETMEQLTTMMKTIREARVQRLILAVDPWLLNPSFNQKSLMMRLHRMESPWMKTVLPWIKFGKDFQNQLKSRWSAYPMLLTDRKFPWELLKSREKGIGIEAKLNDRGFARDGHYLNPSFRGEKEVSKEAYIEELLKDSFRFAPAPGLDSLALSMLEEALSELSDHSIEVVGVMLPFDPLFYEAMKESEGHVEMLREYETGLPEIFTQAGFQCFNLCDANLVDWEEGDFSDRIHFGEKLTMKIWEKLETGFLQKPSEK